MKLRVPGSAGPMAKGSSDEPRAPHDLVPARTSSRAARVTLEVAETGSHRILLRLDDGALHALVTDPEEHRRALGHREHRVKAGHPRVCRRAGQLLAVARTSAPLETLPAWSMRALVWSR